MSMFIVEKLKHALDAYDPYGNYRVNTFQCVVAVSCLFMLNALFNFPRFNGVIYLPVFGVLALLMSIGYAGRLKAMVIYSVTTIVYALLLSLTHNSPWVTVLVVGVVILTFFSVAKKRVPELLWMIPLVHIAAYTSLKAPDAGLDQLLHWVLACTGVSILTLLLLALFPRIYFFRIWLRVLHYSITELKERLNGYEQNIVISASQLLFTHVARMPAYTAMLSNKEHGFSARRISLKLASIYSGLAALNDQLTELKKTECNELNNLCQEFCVALSNNLPLTHLVFIESDNRFFITLRQDLCYIIEVWNRLCLKL
ncbi:MAG: hypothetical protein V4496_07160 [Pseudomonadota bacterium]